MYSAKQIARGLKNPRRIAREFNALCHTRGGHYRFNPSGTGIFDFEWDYLVILDACRNDVFQDVADLPGSSGSRYSLAPATYEFIRANFAKRRDWDMIYLGAATWYLRLRDEVDSQMFKVVDLQSDRNDIEWADEKLNVPSPESVREHAERITAKYPHKRLIIHFLQPHHPFIGEFGRDHFQHQSSSLLDVVDEANASDEALRSAYHENLSVVLKEVETLLDSLEGRTVITADHGEMLGDRHTYFPMKDYGHHPGIFNEPTVKVPLHIHESGKRPLIREDRPEDFADTNERELTNRLRQLGYTV